MTALPPSLAGATQPAVIFVPDAFAVGDVGAPGVSGTLAIEKVAEAESPKELVALITKVYGVPFVKPGITFVVSELNAVVETPAAVIV